MCATTLTNPTAVAAVEGIIQACRAAGRHVQTTTTFFDPREEQDHLELFLQERVAGVLSFPSGGPADGYLRLQQAGAPVVLLNRRVPGLAAPLVRHDFAGGYALAVGRLASRGHRRIGAILHMNSSGTLAEQAVAWNAAFERLGLAPAPDLIRLVPAAPQTEAIHQAIGDLLSAEHPPTALFAGTALATLVALRLIEAAATPERRSVALVGTGDRRWELLFPRTVPFVCLDSFGLGTTAADILNDLIDSGRDVRSDAEAVMAVRFVDAMDKEARSLV
jgi:DNA-binding LacI/PurR family transcriptional regulator